MDLDGGETRIRGSGMECSDVSSVMMVVHVVVNVSRGSINTRIRRIDG